jgi:hypothetical protein
MEPMSAPDDISDDDDEPRTTLRDLVRRLDTLADGLLAVLDSQDTIIEALTRMETTMSNVSNQQGQLDADVQALTDSNTALTASNTTLATAVTNIASYIASLKTQPAAAGLDFGPLEAEIAAAQTAATGTGTEAAAFTGLEPVVGS